MASKQKLTAKQQAFAKAVSGGMTLTSAYKQCYKAERMKLSSIHAEACLLAANPMVTVRIEELQARLERMTDSVALSDRDNVLGTLRTMMKESDTDMARLRAAELLGKSIGLFKDVIEQAPLRSADEIRRELRARLDMMSDDDPERVH